MKYVKVEWPEIQDYMERSDYKEEVYFDPNKNTWFIPENWDPIYLELQEIKENVFKSIMNEG